MLNAVPVSPCRPHSPARFSELADGRFQGFARPEQPFVAAGLSRRLLDESQQLLASCRGSTLASQAPAAQAGAPKYLRSSAAWR